MKKVIGVICAFALVMTFLLPIRQTSALSKIDSQLLVAGLSSATVKGVFVELDKPTIVMESTFGGRQVFNSRELMRSDNIKTKMLEQSITRWQQKHVNSVKMMIPEVKVVETYMYAFNGYYLELPMNKLELLASNSQVKRIFAIQPKKIFRTRTRALLGAEKTWATVKDPQGRVVDGSGVLVSVSDTGLDYSIPDFGKQTKPIGDKVVISRDLGENDDDCQEDDRGFGTHGTECASLIAADGPDNKETNQKEKGIAPKALLAGYKISKYNSKARDLDLSDSAIMKTWDVMIKDKVSVSNNSYGAPGGFPEFELAQYNCALAGVTVVVSNGNEGTPGPWLFTVPQGDVAAANSVIGVGATDDLDRSDLKIFKSPDPAKQDAVAYGYWDPNSAKLANYTAPLEVIDCVYGRSEDFIGLDVKGKIALITLGPADKNGYYQVTTKTKVENAFDKGAKALIICNDYYGKTEVNTSKVDKKKFLPTYFLNYYDGVTLIELLHSGHDWNHEKTDLKQNVMTVNFTQPNYKGKVADFSSNGPTKLGFLKPDVCAPGVGIHASYPNWVKKLVKLTYDEDFGGTSAAGPFVAGCSALVRQARPEWSPFEVKRALMNTATMLKRTDGEFYYPLVSQGMGRVDVYKAVNTQVMVQPPSGLIIARNGTKKVADVPEELTTQDAIDKLPTEVSTSTFPIKLFNYSKKDVTMSLSFEINSGNPGQFDVDITSDTVKIPAATATPGVAWVGLNIKLPANVEGALNDVIIWMTDKESGNVVHTGFCIYNDDPKNAGADNTFVTNVKFDKEKFSPNGDGVDDEMTISYEVTNGSWVWDYTIPCCLNDGEIMCFWVLDVNMDRWEIIKIVDVFELGPGKFTWDGKDYKGNYIFPDGDWSLHVSVLCHVPNKEWTKLIYGMIGYDHPASFQIENSTVPPLPSVSTYVMPTEPGVGQEMELGIYIDNATNVKSINFHIDIAGASSFVQYQGYDKTDQMMSDDPRTSYSVVYDKEKEQISVKIEKADLLINGGAWLIKVKFIALEANYFDVQIPDLEVTVVDDTNKEKTTKAFRKGCQVSIYSKAYDPCDFNRDEQVDSTDLKILSACLGTKDGDPNYKWRCDLNFDMAVDFSDMAIFARTYQK